MEEDEDDEPPPAQPKKAQPSHNTVLENPKMFWKIACPRVGAFHDPDQTTIKSFVQFALIMPLCTECRNANYLAGNNKYTAEHFGGKDYVRVAYLLCADCAQANFECSDAVLRLGQRKREGGSAGTSNYAGQWAKKWKSDA